MMAERERTEESLDSNVTKENEMESPLQVKDSIPMETDMEAMAEEPMECDPTTEEDVPANEPPSDDTISQGVSDDSTNHSHTAEGTKESLVPENSEAGTSSKAVPGSVTGEKEKEFAKPNENEESQSSTSYSSQQTCYCGKERNLNIVELQCGGCFKWFHESCISIPLGKCVPFMVSYSFACKLCNSSGIEAFSKKQLNFSQICYTALANLTQQCKSEGEPRQMFSKDKEVLPYIADKWEHLTSMQRRITQAWHNTVQKAVMKDTDIFICSENSYDGGPMFGLVNQDLTKIGPSYETSSSRPQKFVDPSQAFGTKGRGSKRKLVDNQTSGFGKKAKSDLVMPKLPPNGYPLEHPFNKDGFRYILAEPDPHAPFRQEFDESQDWAGKPIPPWLYRKLTPSNVLVALHDRAPQLKISDDRLSVTGEKGYCMARATHGINRGTWYFEVNIDDMPDGGATRLGWSQGLANLQGPLGYDKFSYSWRSRKGTRFHESRGKHYSDEGYGQGDTLGFLIQLPEAQGGLVPLPPIYKDKPLVKFKNYLYYEEKDEIQKGTKKLKPAPNSKIIFYKNGKSMGPAFENIYAGTYYPAVSLYKSVTVSFNFGPTFKFPPQETHKTIYDLAHEALIEQTTADLLFFTEKKGKLRLDL